MSEFLRLFVLTYLFLAFFTAPVIVLVGYIFNGYTLKECGLSYKTLLKYGFFAAAFFSAVEVVF